MGLDITAYRALRRIPEADAIAASAVEDSDTFDFELWEQAGYVQFYANSDFPGRELPVLEGLVYVAAETFAFRAGSYSCYGEWREQLAEVAGYRAEDLWGGFVALPAPFAEMVNFSDCEGTLGSIVCAKLASDFAEFQSRADEHTDDYFRAKYAAWRKAAEMAAEGGAIVFH